jgi:hypothetical protein
VLEPEAFISTVFQTLAGGDTRCSLEGRLDQFDFQGTVGHEESGALRRQTIWPWQDFVVLPLDRDAVPPLIQALVADPNWTEHVIHLMVERAGRLAVGPYDNLDPDGTWIGASIERAVLDRMVTMRVVEVVRGALGD